MLLSLQFLSSILSFHGNGSPCSRQFEMEKKTDNGNRQVRRIIWSRRILVQDLAVEDSDSRGEKIAEEEEGEGKERFRGVYRVGQEKFLVLLESNPFSRSSCVFLLWIIPTLSLKECKCCDSGSKGRKLFVYGFRYGEMVIRKSICMPSLRASDTRS